MIRLSASAHGHAAMESETTGFGGAKIVIEKEKVQSNVFLDDEFETTFGVLVNKDPSIYNKRDSGKKC